MKLFTMACLDKDGLREAAAVKGCSNKKTERVADKAYSAGTLRFDGFVGERRPDGLWYGYYRFAVIEADECVRASFAKLFNKTSEGTDGIQSHDNAAGE